MEDRQVGSDAGAGEGVVLEAEEFAGAFVGQHDVAGMVQGEDGEGAGFDQDAYLLFGLFAQQDLGFALGEVFGQVAAALVEGGDEEARHGVAGKRNRQAFGGSGRKLQRVEDVAQEGADRPPPARVCHAFRAEAASRMGKR